MNSVCTEVINTKSRVSRAVENAQLCIEAVGMGI